MKNTLLKALIVSAVLMMLFSDIPLNNITSELHLAIPRILIRFAHVYSGESSKATGAEI